MSERDDTIQTSFLEFRSVNYGQAMRDDNWLHTPREAREVASAGYPRPPEESTLVVHD